MEGLIGVVGSILGAVVSWMTIVRMLRTPVEALQEKVDILEKEKLASLETRLDSHLAADSSQRILALLETIQAGMSLMAGKIDRLCEVSAQHTAQLAADERYIQNLDASFERHKHSHK